MAFSVDSTASQQIPHGFCSPKHNKGRLIKNPSSLRVSLRVSRFWKSAASSLGKKVCCALSFRPSWTLQRNCIVCHSPQPSQNFGQILAGNARAKKKIKLRRCPNLGYSHVCELWIFPFHRCAFTFWVKMVDSCPSFLTIFPTCLFLKKYFCNANVSVYYYQSYAGTNQSYEGLSLVQMIVQNIPIDPTL